MPRVHMVTKSHQGKTYDCGVCGKPITPGQTFYTWSKRYAGTYRQHTEHGYPRPSQLSGRKTAVIEDELQALDLSDISYPLPEDFEPNPEGGNALDLDGVVEDITNALSSVAETARGVGEEYEASADNMPESLQQGYQAEAMRDVNQRLGDWADQLEDPCGSVTTTVDLPDVGDYMTIVCEKCGGKGIPLKGTAPICGGCLGSGALLDMEAWREAAQAAIDEAVAELVGAADGLTGEMPEYEG